MKIYRIVATDGPDIKSKYILAKNRKRAKELAFQYDFSNFLIDTVQPENAIDFWHTLSIFEQKQFEKELINNFLGR